MYKIFCCVISILFLGVCFSGGDQVASASPTVRYISNRVKIIRPEKTVKITASASSETKIKETETTMSSAPGKEVPEVRKPSESVAGFIPGGAVSEKTSEAAIREEVSAIMGKKERFYSRKGRIDPFEPFLRKPAPEAAVDNKAKLKRRVPRTPLEKIDLSQLKLTAVLRSPTKTRALVQESSGKGYVVKEGAYIGNKGGQVSKILKDRIMVEEKYLDVFGKISVRKREMKLQQ